MDYMFKLENEDFGRYNCLYLVTFHYLEQGNSRDRYAIVKASGELGARKAFLANSPSYTRVSQVEPLKFERDGTAVLEGVG